MYGEEDDDRLYGGSEDDLLYGGNGDDELFGRAGDDLLFGGKGSDPLSGGTGQDRADYSTDDDGTATHGVFVNLSGSEQTSYLGTTGPRSLSAYSPIVEPIEAGGIQIRIRIFDDQAAAVGWPKSAASVGRRHRRTAKPVVPAPSAAS